MVVRRIKTGKRREYLWGDACGESVSPSPRMTKISRFARNDDGAKRYHNSAALHFFYAPHQHSSLLTPHSSFFIRSRAFIRDEGDGTSTGEP